MEQPLENRNVPAPLAAHCRYLLLEQEPGPTGREASALKGVISAVFILLIAYGLWDRNWLGAGGLALAFYYFLMLEERIDAVAAEARLVAQEQARRQAGTGASLPTREINWARAWLA